MSEPLLVLSSVQIRSWLWSSFCPPGFLPSWPCQCLVSSCQHLPLRLRVSTGRQSLLHFSIQLEEVPSNQDPESTDGAYITPYIPEGTTLQCTSRLFFQGSLAVFTLPSYKLWLISPTPILIQNMIHCHNPSLSDHCLIPWLLQHPLQQGLTSNSVPLLTQHVLGLRSVVLIGMYCVLISALAWAKYLKMSSGWIFLWSITDLHHKQLVKSICWISLCEIAKL
jgi:hypothetical protein